MKKATLVLAILVLSLVPTIAADAQQTPAQPTATESEEIPPSPKEPSPELERPTSFNSLRNVEEPNNNPNMIQHPSAAEPCPMKRGRELPHVEAPGRTQTPPLRNICGFSVPVVFHDLCQ